MKEQKKLTAVLLAGCLVVSTWPTTLSAATRRNPGITKHHVELLGVETVVEVKLATGEKLRGSISAIDGDSFDVLPTRERAARRIAYDQVTTLKSPKSTYLADAPLWVQVAGMSAVAILVILLCMTGGRHQCLSEIRGLRVIRFEAATVRRSIRVAGAAASV